MFFFLSLIFPFFLSVFLSFCLSFNFSFFLSFFLEYTLFNLSFQRWSFYFFISFELKPRSLSAVSSVSVRQNICKCFFWRLKLIFCKLKHFFVLALHRVDPLSFIIERRIHFSFGHLCFFIIIDVSFKLCHPKPANWDGTP